MKCSAGLRINSGHSAVSRSNWSGRKGVSNSVVVGGMTIKKFQTNLLATEWRTRTEMIWYTMMVGEISIGKSRTAAAEIRHNILWQENRPPSIQTFGSSVAATLRWYSGFRSWISLPQKEVWVGKLFGRNRFASFYGHKLMLINWKITFFYRNSFIHHL